ncbi:hypothetical protein GQ600_3234 [Phytophthora cactorum]|nr:hypothetical protein GQ600_3234 [Phytophthora cactorum]
MPMHYTDQPDDYRVLYSKLCTLGNEKEKSGHGTNTRLVDKAVDAVEPEIVGACLRCRHAGSRSTESDDICDCVESIMELQLPLLCLSAGGYSGADAS